MMEVRITARKNPLLQQVRKLLTSRKEREASGLFVADGTKLLQEAVRYWPALENMVVVIGSEGQGVRQEILESADAQLIIPMNPRCESLNAAVAATIVMWQMGNR